MHKTTPGLVLSFGSLLIGYLVQSFFLQSGGDGNPDRRRSVSNTANWIKFITLGAMLPGLDVYLFREDSPPSP